MIRAARAASVWCVGMSWFIVFPGYVTILQAAGPSPQDDAGESAEHILKTTGITGGLIVHLGCGDGQLTASLRANDEEEVPENATP